MLRWYYRIKSARRDKVRAYTLDNRLCKSPLGPGFTTYLQHNHFFDIQSSRYRLPKQKRLWLRWSLLILGLMLLGWVAIESALYLML